MLHRSGGIELQSRHKVQRAQKNSRIEVALKSRLLVRCMGREATAWGFSSKNVPHRRVP